MKIALIMDPPETLKPAKDSSVALMQAGLKAGHEILYFTQPEIFIEDQKAQGYGRRVESIENSALKFADYQDYALGSFDLVFMRKDPPVDKAFMQTTFILAQAEKEGVKIINSPASLQRYNEKIYASLFPAHTPRTLIGCDKDKITAFINTVDRAVLKPVDMMGGYGVFVSKAGDHNLDVIIELLTQNGKTHIIVQEFLPAIVEGDRRLIIIDGQIAGHALVRYPKEGSLRGNMAAGGSYKVEEVNNRDCEIAAAVGPRLQKDGVFFAGLDVIGGKLIEINHTSPTGLREISQASGEDLAQRIIAEATA
ncbi:MAG: glutathione synthase [Alphaproteobacteria bacterium]